MYKGRNGAPIGAIIALATASLSAFTQLPVALAAPTITTIDNAGSAGHGSAITIGADNLPIISYTDLNNLKVVHCGNASCTTGNTITTLVTNNVGIHTSIAIGSDNLAIISYYNDLDQSLRIAHCGNTTCTSGNTLVGVAFGGVGNYSSITIANDNLPVISYSDDIFLTLKFVHCGNNTCSSVNTYHDIDSVPSVGNPNSLAIGADNLPVVSYYDSTSNDLKVAHCGDNDCSIGTTTTTVDATGFVGGYNDIAIGSDNLPIISYIDESNNSLKVTHCGNNDCSSGNTSTTVDNTTYVSFSTSITRGSDNLPIISYYDVTSADLKIAHCGNVSCSSGNTLTTIDDTGNVGQESFIAVVDNAFPIISYFDASGGALKYAHCDNYLCNVSGGNEAPFFSPWSLTLLGIGIFVYLKREQLLPLHD